MNASQNTSSGCTCEELKDGITPAGHFCPQHDPKDTIHAARLVAIRSLEAAATDLLDLGVDPFDISVIATDALKARFE